VDGSSPDVELVTRCLEGDEVAWGQLVDRYARYVHAIVTRGYRLRDVEAEDVFQEVFTRVFERLHTLREPEALRGWIAQTTRRTCVDRLRLGSREILVADPDELPSDDPYDVLDEAFAVRAALAELPVGCAEVLDRFFCRDESYRTIAEALDLPAGTIASRISRCLEKLRTALVEESTLAVGKKADVSSVR
jgi:RNA polymerase sigma factor (sigma-70 family)